MTTSSDTDPRAASFPSLQWWIRDSDGDVALVQAPNAALIVWFVSVVVGWTGAFDHDRDATVTRAGQGALVVWALDEVLRGSSPARRLLGAIVLIAMLVRLLG